MRKIIIFCIWAGLQSVQQTDGLPANNNWYKYLDNYDTGYKQQENYNYQYGGVEQESSDSGSHGDDHSGDVIAAPPCNDGLNKMGNGQHQDYHHQSQPQPQPSPQPSPQPQPQQPQQPHYHHQSKYVVPGGSHTTVNVHNLWPGHKYIDHPEIPCNYNTGSNNGKIEWENINTKPDNTWSNPDANKNDNDWHKEEEKKPNPTSEEDNTKKVYVIQNQHQPQIIQKQAEYNGYYPTWNNYGNYGGHNDKQGKPETYVHQPPSFIIKPQATNLKIIHPEYHVKPAPVILQKTCHVHNHHAIIKPPPIKVNPILFTIHKPVEKKVIIEKQPCYDQHQPHEHHNHHNHQQQQAGNQYW